MKMKEDDDAIGLMVGLLILFVIIILGAVVLSFVLGLFGFIGICLLLASAYILFMAKGKVTIKSPFFILLIAGLSLIFISQVAGMEIYTVELAEFRWTLLKNVPFLDVLV